jgi:hypothetical protein
LKLNDGGIIEVRRAWGGIDYTTRLLLIVETTHEQLTGLVESVDFKAKPNSIKIRRILKGNHTTDPII